MADLHNIPTSPRDKETAQSAAWAEANRNLGSLSHFNYFPYQDFYLGFGPEPGEMDLSAFWEYGPINTGWGGDFPTEVQPTFPDIPAHLQDYRG